MKRKLPCNKVEWMWDDDNMLGDFIVDCPCGKKSHPKILDIDKDKVYCECGRIFYVERTTKVFYDDIERKKGVKRV